MAESDTPKAGSEVALALDTKPQPGWHGYWQNPGDAGFAAKLDWTLPKGVTAGAPAYPAPQRLLIAGLMNYVFERPYAPIVTLKMPAGLAAGTALPIKLHMAYLVCTDAIVRARKRRFRDHADGRRRRDRSGAARDVRRLAARAAAAAGVGRDLSGGERRAADRGALSGGGEGRGRLFLSDHRPTSSTMPRRRRWRATATG